MRNVVLGALCLLALAACNYRRDKGDDRLQQGAGWFVRVQAAVLQPSCVKCHEGPNAKKGIDLSSYALVMRSGTVIPFKPGQSALLTSITGNRMPQDRPGSLPAESIALLRRWIEAGAPETNQAVPPPPPEKPKPTYRWLNENVFQRRCVQCHKPAVPPEEPKPQNAIDFTTYATLMSSYGNIFKAVDEGSSATSGVYDQVRTQQMPPENREKLNAEEVRAIGTWIDSGAKENE